MTFLEANKTVYKTKYMSIKGRASRSEYWWSVLGAMLAIFASLAIVGLGASMSVGGEFNAIGKIGLILALLVYLYLLIPNITVVVRRLHDLDKSGWWYLGLIVPFLNIYVAIIVMFVKGTSGDNQFGPDPLA